MSPPVSPGQPLAELDTPALVVDLDAFHANIAHMASACARHQKAWRPHSKAHKSPAVARLLIEAGACGITCAKLSEAECMAEAGIDDILIANQIVSPSKLRRLARLQHRARVQVGLDNPAVVAPLRAAAAAEDATIPLLIEVDVGMGRVGVQTEEEALELARLVEQAAPHLQLDGIMGYEGHVLAISPEAKKQEACTAALDLLAGVAEALEAGGFEVGTVSAGGTGSFHISVAHPAVTELQAGGGIFMDAMYRDAFRVPDLQPALSVVATVTSRQRGHIVVDAGFKTLSAFHHPPAPIGRSDLSLRYLSAEHGVFDLKEGCEGPQVGERLELRVGYSDSTNFLHDCFVGVRDGRVETVWPLEARGLLV